jgi:hypothetical protein
MPPRPIIGYDLSVMSTAAASKASPWGCPCPAQREEPKQDSRTTVMIASRKGRRATKISITYGLRRLLPRLDRVWAHASVNR